MSDSELSVEEWRVCIGFSDYEISNFGWLRRLKGNQLYPAGSLVKGHEDHHGYRKYSLNLDGKVSIKFAHTLVVEAFIGPKPSPAHMVAHWDGQKQNNHVSNLRWATAQENADDSKRLGAVSTERRPLEMSPFPPTKRMLDMLICIHIYQEEHGYIPSYEEMVDMLGLKSKSGIHRLVTGLEERGLLKRAPYQARAMALTIHGKALAGKFAQREAAE